jgi:hypothetical protein
VSTPPAWHPDPTGRHDHRWWDGERWTEHVADAGQASVDPIEGGDQAGSDTPDAAEDGGAADTTAAGTAEHEGARGDEASTGRVTADSGDSGHEPSAADHGDGTNDTQVLGTDDTQVVEDTGSGSASGGWGAAAGAGAAGAAAGAGSSAQPSGSDAGSEQGWQQPGSQQGGDQRGGDQTWQQPGTQQPQGGDQAWQQPGQQGWQQPGTQQGGDQGWQQPGGTAGQQGWQQPGGQQGWQQPQGGQQGWQQPQGGDQGWQGQSWQGGAPGYQPAPGIDAPATKPSRLPLAAMITGLVSIPGLFLCGLGLIGGIVAIVLGFVALSRIKRDGAGSKGQAWTGIITGFLAIVLGIVAIVAFAVPFAQLTQCIEETGDQAFCESQFEDDLIRRFGG